MSLSPKATFVIVLLVLYGVSTTRDAKKKQFVEGVECLLRSLLLCLERLFTLSFYLVS